ncbi:hypothetical protein PV10_00259 [Exophiala mesophila]|uniref:Uncharacterized protein n=1 Tax=Exophiala mesophila TaxID=212818 RepID=A0A0D2ABS8_EXOME|nr:uncharacterized protein PV10_00259 [Exophiala mesophila]KIV96378.1 hypothetical protein PV10_00259 [Exophiala mesophila]
MKLSNNLLLLLPFLFSEALGDLEERAAALRRIAVTVHNTFEAMNRLGHIPEIPSPHTYDYNSVSLDFDAPDLGSLDSGLDPNRVANYSLKSISPYLTPQATKYAKANPFAFVVNFGQLMSKNPTDDELLKIIRMPTISEVVTTTLTTRVSSTVPSVTAAPSLVSKVSSLLSVATSMAAASSSIIDEAVNDNIFHLAGVLYASATSTAPASNPTKVIKMTFPANEVWPRRTATLTVRNLPTAK